MNNSQSMRGAPEPEAFHGDFLSKIGMVRVNQNRKVSFIVIGMVKLLLMSVCNFKLPLIKCHFTQYG